MWRGLDGAAGGGGMPLGIYVCEKGWTVQIALQAQQAAFMAQMGGGGGMSLGI